MSFTEARSAAITWLSRISCKASLVVPGSLSFMARVQSFLSQTDTRQYTHKNCRFRDPALTAWNEARSAWYIPGPKEVWCPFEFFG